MISSLSTPYASTASPNASQEPVDTPHHFSQLSYQDQTSTDWDAISKAALRAGVAEVKVTFHAGLECSKAIKEAVKAAFGSSLVEEAGPGSDIAYIGSRTNALLYSLMARLNQTMSAKTDSGEKRRFIKISISGVYLHFYLIFTAAHNNSPERLTLWQKINHCIMAAPGDNCNLIALSRPLSDKDIADAKSKGFITDIFPAFLQPGLRKRDAKPRPAPPADAIQEARPQPITRQPTPPSPHGAPLIPETFHFNLPQSGAWTSGLSFAASTSTEPHDWSMPDDGWMDRPFGAYPANGANKQPDTPTPAHTNAAPKPPSFEGEDNTPMSPASSETPKSQLDDATLEQQGVLIDPSKATQAAHHIGVDKNADIPKGPASAAAPVQAETEVAERNDEPNDPVDQAESGEARDSGKNIVSAAAETSAPAPRAVLAGSISVEEPSSDVEIIEEHEDPTAIANFSRMLENLKNGNSDSPEESEDSEEEIVTPPGGSPAAPPPDTDDDVESFPPPPSGPTLKRQRSSNVNSVLGPATINGVSPGGSASSPPTKIPCLITDPLPAYNVITPPAPLPHGSPFVLPSRLNPSAPIAHHSPSTPPLSRQGGGGPSQQ